MGNFVGKLKAAVGRALAFKWDTEALPQLDGTIKLPPGVLKGKVAVERDVEGLPHITAEHLEDLFLVQGYVSAQDRLWQMETTRRAAMGTLSELVGPKGIEDDKLARTLGWSRLAKADWERVCARAQQEEEAKQGSRLEGSSPKFVRDSVLRYVQGVNLFIETPGRKLPVEFRFANVKQVAKWEPVQVMSIGRLMCFQMSFGFESPLVRAHLASIVGWENCVFFVNPDPEAPPHVPDSMADFDFGPEVSNEAAKRSKILDQLFDFKQWDFGSLIRLHEGIPRFQGSNAWVVHGSRTDNGMPILSGDPHLMLRNPSIFIPMHLRCQNAPTPLDVIGLTIPGNPTVVIGHNRQVAWSITLSFACIEELFVEKVRSKDGTMQYEHTFGDWREAQIVTEVIHVKDSSPVEHTVRLTARGPLITDSVCPVVTQDEKGLLQSCIDSKVAVEDADWKASKEGLQLVLASKCLQEENTTIDAFGALNFATGCESAREALKLINLTTLNFILADDEGHIAYQLTGCIPIRGAANVNFLPQPAWDPAFQWKGEVPFEHMPFCIDPPQGFLVSANHRIVDYSVYPYWLGDLQMAGNRARVITQCLSGQGSGLNGTWTLEDSQKLQHNVTTLHGKMFVEILERKFPANDEAVKALSPNVQLALEILRGWGTPQSKVAKSGGTGEAYQLHKDNYGAAVFYVSFHVLVRHLICDVITNQGAKKGANKEHVQQLVRMMMGGGFHVAFKPVCELDGWMDIGTLRVLEREDSWWCQQVGGSKAVLTKALHEAISLLRGRYGADPVAWRYGLVHSVVFEHPFSRVLGPKPFDIGPCEVGGDAQTVRMTRMPRASTAFAPSPGISAVLRMNVPMAHVGDAVWSMPLGCSGQLSSPLRTNLLDAYVGEGFFRLRYDDRDIADGVRNQLEFV